MKSSELLMLQDVWRKAWLEGGLDLQFRTKSGAHRARMQLYNAVKQQKAGTDLDDMDLVRAAEGLEIVWLGETGLRMQRKDNSDMIQGLAAALGRTMTDYIDPDAAASSQRMLEELMGKAKPQSEEDTPAPAQHLANPYFDRREV